MATIKDVAKLANVSIASVSRYFNNKELLREETRIAIEEAVKALNYHPSSLGRSLRIARSGKFLVLLPTIANPFYSRILSSISAESQKYGYTVITCTHGNDNYTEKSLLQLLHNHYADGVILFASTLTSAELEDLSKKYPVVQCCEYLEDANVSTVTIDNKRAAFDAITHLESIGHKKIAMVSGMENYESTRQRQQGYLAALEKYKLPVRNEYIINGMYGYNSGMKAAQLLLELPDPPTAVFTVSDALAIGVIRQAVVSGMKVGKAFSVVGFDNTTIASMYMPDITSVAQPREEMGKEAVRLLMDRITNLRIRPELVMLPHKLIVRGSTADE